MVKCLICRRVYNKAFDVSFHRFPSDQATRKLWCRILSHSIISPTDRVCSQHFTDNCFQVHKELGQRILKPYSTPTLAMKKLQEPMKVTCSWETVLTDHNYVAKLEKQEIAKTAEPAKLLIQYPYILNTQPNNVVTNVMQDLRVNIPLTYQPLVTNISQPFSGNMMYALKINPPPNPIQPVKQQKVILKNVKNRMIVSKEEMKRRALILKKKKEERKLHETTVKKLQSASKKIIVQRQTIKMLRQKLRRLQRRFEIQKSVVKYLNFKLEGPNKEKQITIVGGHF